MCINNLTTMPTMKHIQPNLFFSFILFMNMIVSVAQPIWLKKGSYAIYQGQVDFIILHDCEYWASDYGVRYFNAYFKWNITELDADNLQISIELDIFNGSKHVSRWDACLNVDIHSQNIINGSSIIGPLMLWTSAKQVGDVVPLPIHSSGRIDKDYEAFNLDTGVFHIITVNESARIITEMERANLEWVYGFEKDSGLLIYLNGVIIDPIFEALGIRYLSASFEITQTNVPIKESIYPYNIIAIMVTISLIGISTLIVLRYKSKFHAKIVKMQRS